MACLPRFLGLLQRRVRTVRRNHAKKPTVASKRPRGSSEKTEKTQRTVHPRVRQIDLPPRLPAGCLRGRYGAGGQPVVQPKAAAVQRQEPYARARGKKPSGRSRPKARGEEGKEGGDRHIIAAPPPGGNLHCCSGIVSAYHHAKFWTEGAEQHRGREGPETRTKEGAAQARLAAGGAVRTEPSAGGRKLPPLFEHSLCSPC